MLNKGAPGMNMDPMAMSQGMFGGYGGQDGMGMNGMNGMSGMTMGMGFDAGQGGYGMWDGNAGWNANQDKFNPNANGSHTAGMGAPFGANAGFASSNGYNVQSSHPGNFNQLPLQPFPNNNFQSGFNGPDYRRSSGFGLGGQGPSQGQNASAHNVADDSEAFHHQLPPGFQPQSSQKLQPQQDMPSEPQGENGGETETKSNDADAEKGADANQKKAEENMPEGLVPVDETNGEPKGADTEETKSENASSDAVQQNGGPSSQKGTPVQHSATIGVQRSISGTPPVGPGPMQTNPIPTVPMSQVMPTDSMPPMGSMGPMGPMGPMMPMAGPMGPMGPTGMYPAGPDQFFAGRGRGMNGGFYHGGPNHFRGNLRGRGGFGPGPMGPGHGMDFSGMPQGPPRGMGVAGAPTAPKALRQGLPNTSVLRNRSFGIGGRASQSQTPGVDSSAEQQQQDSQQQKSPPADDVAALER
ncbi:hypothetical protein L228DRAFT_156560 [Xylona heveae TC161]|uniref:Uncharacterized protein n=1 Tax=Xylona heveae (strain CBS 132557 / TC161) TaxID=1328760 RepID=A0A165G167_XYLHT|nr:hypothetical protein L228DRAFT_156560 [Xylona heveae TC161]KZF21622.1 hypothetical protein L228DRAFT_156560 [Xylona heveae TC161]